jgi:NADPH:quinone reductase-like Zn-dependent oxidoreductase
MWCWTWSAKAMVNARFRSRNPTVTAVGRTDAGLAQACAAAGVRFAGITVEPDRIGLEKLAALVDSGQLSVHVWRMLDLSEAVDAHRLMERGDTTGKIVLIP